ncbi:MAG: galactitol-1-phosphate 5-dehydrogenase [Chloroflexota bacterium]
MMQALMLTAIKEQKLVDVPEPAIKRPDEVLVKVKSVGICGSDLHGYAGHTGRRVPPLIMGHEAAGEVVATGAAVTNLPPGIRVAVLPLEFCGSCAQCLAGRRNICENRRVMGMHAPGAYAEYVTWPAANLFRLPDRLAYEHAALAEPLAVAVHAVGLAHIQPYDTAFIVGAGTIGLLTLAVLRQSGVRHIIVSDTSAARLELAHSLGASATLNPTRRPLPEVLEQVTGGRGVDLAFEAVGISAAAQQTLAVTRHKGTIIWIGNSQRTVEVDMQAIVTRELTVLGSYGMNEQDFQRSLQMLADDQIPAGRLINRRARLSEGPRLFDELLASPETIKCVINF